MKIAIDQVKKLYGEQVVLDHIDIHLENVEAVVLLGKSGSGKSTLLRLMSGIEGFDSGDIHINDTEVDTRAFKDTIGFVFQTGSLFGHLSLLNNIVLILDKVKKVPRDEAIKRVETLLTQFDLIEHKDKYPHMLSGGQQQRASIVRSLAVNAEIFFFDEPTSALDPILTNEVLNTIKTLREIGKKFFIVTHEVGFAKNVADYVLFLDEGKIVEEGPTDILDNPKTEAFQRFLEMVPR